MDEIVTKTNIIPAEKIVFILPDGREYKITDLTQNPEIFLENYNILSINTQTHQNKEQIELAEKYPESIDNQETKILDHGHKDNKIFLTNLGSELMIHIYLEEQRIRSIEGQKKSENSFINSEIPNKTDLNVTKFIGDIISETKFKYEKVTEFLNEFYIQSDKIKKDNFIENVIYENATDSYTIKLSQEGEKWLINELRVVDNLESKIYEKNKELVNTKLSSNSDYLVELELKKEQEYLENLERTEPSIKEIENIELKYKTSITTKNSISSFDEIYLETFKRANETIDEAQTETFDDSFLEDVENILIPANQRKPYKKLLNYNSNNS